MDLPLADRSNFTAKQLVIEDAELLQELCEQCADFSQLVEGTSPSPGGAHEIFRGLPRGKNARDKFVFGFYGPDNRLLAVIESIYGYPDGQTWWIGLMMVAPAYRGQGLGKVFYRAFEQWVAAQNIFRISLGVIEENTSGLEFWKAMGFEVIDKTEPRQFGNKVHAVHVMRRVLGKR